MSDMKIGITYDLKEDYLKLGLSDEQAAEFDKIETIDAIDKALAESGFETDRIGHAKALLEKLHRGQRWDAVFNICEGLHGAGREAQVPAILDLFEIPYVFSDPMVLALTLHKGMTKQIIRDLGLPTAPFFVVHNEDEISRVELPYPLFVKPVAEGTGKGIGSLNRINNAEELRLACKDQLFRFKQPVLVETYLPGREFTAGITGTGNKARCIGVMECRFRENARAEVYSYENKSNYTEYLDYCQPESPVKEDVSKLAVEAWKGLGCRDGGRVDIRMDAGGIPNFIEVNPLAGLHPVDSDLIILAKMNGINYTELIGLIMDSALERFRAEKQI